MDDEQFDGGTHRYEQNPVGTARMLADLLNAIDVERLKDRAAVAKADGRKETSEHLQKIIDVIEGK